MAVKTFPDRNILMLKQNKKSLLIHIPVPVIVMILRFCIDCV